MENLIIQNPTSRIDSVRHRLSQLSWTRGIGNFFIENIPFSYSTSAHLASQIAALITEFSKTKHTLNLYELGAGLGLLTRQLYDYYEKQDSSTLKKLQFHVSDGAKESVDMVKKLGLYEGRNIKSETIDFVHAHYENPIDIGIMAYLLDSLDTRHILVENGKMYEITLSTSIPHDAYLIDTTVFPPTYLDAKAVKTLLNSGEIEEQKKHLSKLSDLLIEEVAKRPIEQSGMTDEELALLKAFVSHLNPKGSIRFNFSYAGIQGLRRVLDACKPESFIFLYDFGDTTQKPTFDYKHLIDSYGACICFNVFLPLVGYIAKEYGFTMTTTDFKQGHSQMTLLTRGCNLTKTFQAVFKEEGGKNAQKAVRDIRKIDKDDPQFLQKITDSINSIPKIERESQTLLMTAALECFKRYDYDNTLRFCEEVLTHYPHTSLVTYYLIGQAYQETKQFDKALVYLKKALELSTDHAGVYYQMSLVYGKIEDLDAFIETAKGYFIASDRYILWSHYVTMALIWLAKNEKEKAKSLIDGLLAIHAQNNTVIKQEIIGTLNEIKEKYF